MTQPGLFAILEAELEQLPLVKINGRVAQVVGLVAESQGPDVRVGDLCRICFRDGSHGLDAEVVGFRDDRVLLMPLGDLREVGPGCDVISTNHPLEVGVGEALLGRILDGLGEPMDDRGPLAATDFYPLYAEPPHPLRRQMVERPLSVGVRVVDGMLTLGTGQRIGIFAGSGVGKSTLLGMMARYTTADVNVISLVGERGREVREFIERDLGPEGLARSVLIIATSDQPPLIRLKAALTATAVAEYFRDQGRDVLLMMDSVTRVARAQREIGLAIGEPAWQLVDALVTEPGEAQLEHPWADAFIGTGLAETLGGLGAGRVWLGGFGSDDGVLQTYLGALYRGFDATLIEDGHAAAEAVFDDWRWPAEQVTAFVNRIVWRDLTPEATGNLMASGNIEFATEGPDDAELLAQAEAEAAAGEEAADRLAGSPGQTGSDD